MFFLRKIWAFLKSYWYVPFILIGSFIFIGRMKDFDFDKILKKGRETHEKETKAIEKAEVEKQKRRAEIEKQKEKRLAQVEAEFLKNRKVLDEENRKKVKKVVSKYHKNPKKIANYLSKKYGYEIVLPED